MAVQLYRKGYAIHIPAGVFSTQIICFCSTRRTINIEQIEAINESSQSKLSFETKHNKKYPYIKNYNSIFNPSNITEPIS